MRTTSRNVINDGDCSVLTKVVAMSRDAIGDRGDSDNSGDRQCAMQVVMVVIESAQMHFISTTCATLSHSKRAL
jgi:hypothetical protein